MVSNSGIIDPNMKFDKNQDDLLSPHTGNESMQDKTDYS